MQWIFSLTHLGLVKKETKMFCWRKAYWTQLWLGKRNAKWKTRSAEWGDLGVACNKASTRGEKTRCYGNITGIGVRRRAGSEPQQFYVRAMVSWANHWISPKLSFLCSQMRILAVLKASIRYMYVKCLTPGLGSSRHSINLIPLPCRVSRSRTGLSWRPEPWGLWCQTAFLLRQLLWSSQDNERFPTPSKEVTRVWRTESCHWPPSTVMSISGSSYALSCVPPNSYVSWVPQDITVSGQSALNRWWS